MELRPHDLLKIDTKSIKIKENSLPEWAIKSLCYAPYVVVRRSPIIANKIPVGIRGEFRNQRHGFFINYEDISERITPESLVSQRLSKNDHRHNDIHALKALDDVKEILEGSQLSWGPTGSIGFELASHINTATSFSDLDIIIRVPVHLAVMKAKQLFDSFKYLNVHIDVQLETPIGAISLQEYANSKHQLVALKTLYGPCFVKNPWKAK